MDLEIPHVRESHGCGEDDRYGYLGGEISEEKFGKIPFRCGCHDNDDEQTDDERNGESDEGVFPRKALVPHELPPNVAHFFGFRRGGIRDLFSESWDMGGLTLADDGV